MLDEPKVIKYEITLNSYFVPDNVNCWAKELDEHFTFAFQDYEKKSLPNTFKEEYFDLLVERFKKDLFEKGILIRDYSYLLYKKIRIEINDPFVVGPYGPADKLEGVVEEIDEHNLLIGTWGPIKVNPRTDKIVIVEGGN